jgi:capsular polysaccharide transport system permease protein
MQEPSICAPSERSPAPPGHLHRSPAAVAAGVWRALILREAVTRLSLRRAAWFWLLLEPAEQVIYLVALHALIRHLVVPGVDVPLFIGVGVLPFFAMRSVALRGASAIDANQALFAYRQIKPVDTVLARAVLEGLLYLLVGTLFVAVCAAFGARVLIDDPLAVATGAALLWAVGLGLGLNLSAAGTLIPEIGQAAKLAFGPLYLLSATMYPSAWIPAPARAWLALNPLVHGIEMVRGGYFAAYRVPDFVSPGYLALWALGLVASGLGLHRHYSQKLRQR